MTIQTRSIGYIRSVCYTKVMGMITPAQIVKVEAIRGMQRSVKRVAIPPNPKVPFIFFEHRTEEEYALRWDGPECGGCFPNEKVKTMISTKQIGDMTINRLVFSFKSPKTIDLLNNELEMRAVQKHKKPILLKQDCLLYATFRSCCSDDLKKLNSVVHLNQKAILDLGFKVACLDLVDLRTERSVNYGENEAINVNDSTKLIRQVLKDALNWDGWPEQERTYEVDHKHQVDNPVAIRTYNLKGQNEWVLAGEEEIR